MKKPKIYNFIALTSARQAAMQALARHPEGAVADTPLRAALWPTLVAMNLAERLPWERGFPTRYRLLPAGQDLAGADASGARMDGIE